MGIVGDILGDVSDVANAASDVAQSAIDALGSAVGDTPVAKQIVDGIKKVEGTLQSIPGLGKVDLKSYAEHTDWRSVIGKIQGGVSTVPIIGTAASDVLATGLVAYDVLTSANRLEAALRTAYEYIIGTVPQLGTYRWALDPVFDALVRVAVDQEPPSSALLHSLVDSVPDAPQFGDLTPRTVVAALVQVIVAHRDIRDAGLDLAAEASGAAGPDVERAARGAAQTLEHGGSVASAILTAVDVAAVQPAEREAFDKVRTALGALGQSVLPEDLAAQFSRAATDVSSNWMPAVFRELRAAGHELPLDSPTRALNLLRAGRPYLTAMVEVGELEGLSASRVARIVAMLPSGLTTRDEIVNVATLGGAMLTFAQALWVAEDKRPINLSKVRKLRNPVEQLEYDLERLPVNLRGPLPKL